MALLAGLGLGLIGHFSGLEAFATAGKVAQEIGDLWISALRLIALPLALGLMLAAISNARAGSVGSLGGRAIAFIVIALVATFGLSFWATSALLRGYTIAPEAVAAMNSGINIPASVAGATAFSFEGWVGGLLPKNLFEAAVRGDMLSLLLFVMVVGLAITRLPDEHRLPLAQAAEGFSQAMQVVVRWLLVVMPIGVFVLSYVMALKTGGALAGMLGVYLATQPVVTLLAVALIYATAATLGRTSLRAFARAVFPAQLVAVSTRSSLAALPALVQGGRDHADLSPAATSFLLPFCVSLFRISEVISNPVKLVFLAHIYGIALTPGTVIAFFITVLMFSFSGTGTPNSGGGIGYRMVPVFLAAGIPIEGVMVLEAVETIPDIFATLANVTGQMGATVVLARR